MDRRYLLVMALAFALIFHFMSGQAEASTIVKGTFVDVSYEEVRVGNNETELRLKSVTLKNDQGRTVTYAIDRFATLMVDQTPTVIEAFKSGMKVEAEVQLRRVKQLQGFSTENPGAIEVGEKVVMGTVNRVDPNGRFVSIQTDHGGTKTYYLDVGTEIYKDQKLVDLSVLFEGDRVKLAFSKYDTNYIHSIDIQVQGIKVERLYKATIERVEPIQRSLRVKETKEFMNWDFQSVSKSSNRTFTYSSSTPIYVGDKVIDRNRLRSYVNNEVYFVTVTQFGKEIVERIIIKKGSEQTFYEPMTSVNLRLDRVQLKTTGAIPYHEGTIFIRNGRLVDRNSLQSGFGTAFVVTQGTTKASRVANVIHITNDGFQSPNLVNHSIYYGQVAQTNAYTLTLRNASMLTHNNWQNVGRKNLTFTNDTLAVRDGSTGFFKVMPNELNEYPTRYAYFYVAGDEIIRAHFIEPNKSRANQVSVGRIDQMIKDKNNQITSITVRNVSRWLGNSWGESGYTTIDVKQATIIREGKVISVNELKPNERVYVLLESNVKGKILLVN